MAFRRSLTARAKVFYQQQQRVALPLSLRVDRDDNDRRRQELQIHDLRRRGGGGNINAGSISRGDRRFAAPAAFAPRFVRSMSSSSSKGEGLGAENVAAAVTDNLEMVNEAAEKAVEAVAPLANEVATDPILHFINHLHTLTGGNWLASIALSTILLRTLLLPLTIHQTKATYIFTLIRPQVEEIQEEIAKSRNEKNPIAAAVGEARMRKLFNEYRFNRFNNFVSFAAVSYINICFFYSMLVMNAEQVNGGGASYILPLFTAFTFWRAMKCHGDEYISGKFCGVAAALILPVTAFLPKGLLCYWIASNLYGLAYGTVMKNEKVKKMLGIPNIAEAPQFNPLLFVMPASLVEWIVPSQLCFCYSFYQVFGAVA